MVSASDNRCCIFNGDSCSHQSAVRFEQRLNQLRFRRLGRTDWYCVAGRSARSNPGSDDERCRTLIPHLRAGYGDAGARQECTILHAGSLVHFVPRRDRLCGGSLQRIRVFGGGRYYGLCACRRRRWQGVRICISLPSAGIIRGNTVFAWRELPLRRDRHPQHGGPRDSNPRAYYVDGSGGWADIRIPRLVHQNGSNSLPWVAAGCLRKRTAFGRSIARVHGHESCARCLGTY